MGQVSSMVMRRVNRFNAENRAHRFLERDKLAQAPKYDGNYRDMERTLEMQPGFLDELNKKDGPLDDRLKNVYVTSEEGQMRPGLVPKEAKYTQPDSRPLPTNRETPQYFEFGHMEPKRVPLGRCTMRQAIQFLTDHQRDPELWTAKKIADDYKMKEPLVADILQHFRIFSVYIPDKRLENEKLLTQMKPKMLSDKQGDQPQPEK